MAQIIQDQSAGGKLGSALGDTLRYLAENRLAKIQQHEQLQQQQRRRQSGLESLFSAEQAKALSALDPELLKPLITEHVKSQRQLESTGPGLKVIAPELNEDEATKIGKLSKGVQNLWYKNYLNSPEQAIQQLRDLPNEPGKKDISNFAKTNKNNLKQQMDQPSLHEPEKIETPFQQLAQKQEVIASQKPKKLSDYMKEGYTRQEAKDLFTGEIKAAQQANKDKIREQELNKKTNRDTIDEINKSSKTAELNDKILNRMEKLSKEGNLGIPFVNSALKTLAHGIFGIGIDLTSLMPADAQEFDKLSSQLATGVSGVFPGRILQSELEVFMKQLPNLYQSGAAQRRVINSMRSANKAIELRKKTMNEILKENKNPENLNLEIEERIGPELDKLAKEFINAPTPKERLLGGIIRY